MTKIREALDLLLTEAKGRLSKKDHAAAEVLVGAACEVLDLGERYVVAQERQADGLQRIAAAMEERNKFDIAEAPKG